MAFIPYKNNRGAAVSFKYMPCDDITVTLGEALKVSSGHLVACGTTDKPEYIAMESKTITTDGNPLYVLIVEPTTEFETAVVASVTTIGARYKLDSYATGVQNDTTSGVAELLEVQPDRLVVRF